MCDFGPTSNSYIRGIHTLDIHNVHINIKCEYPVHIYIYIILIYVKPLVMFLQVCHVIAVIGGDLLETSVDYQVKFVSSLRLPDITGGYQWADPFRAVTNILILI